MCRPVYPFSQAIATSAIPEVFTPRLRSFLAVATLGLVTGCTTVSDMVVSNIPDDHKGKPRIVVKLHDQQALLFKGKAEIAESRISTGREGHCTPPGSFKVIKKDANHRSSLYGNYVDASGKVIVGNVDVRKTPAPPHTHLDGASMPFFLEFSPGFGLHAGYLPGYPASHGCVRMPYWKARQFFNVAKVGTPVLVEK